MQLPNHPLVLLFVAFASTIALSTDARATLEKSPVKTAQTGNPEIIVIGASYAKDWPVETLAGRRVVNRGIGGQESHEVAARFEKDVVAQRPSAVIVWGFINDIFRSSPDALPAKKEAIKKNLLQMIEVARRNNITPIVATEVTVRGKEGSMKDTVIGWIGSLLGKRSYADNINEHVQEVNNWLRQYATANAILLLDLQVVLSESNGLRKKEYANPDGSHLTPAAYDALTKYADPKLSLALPTSANKAAARN